MFEIRKKEKYGNKKTIDINLHLRDRLDIDSQLQKAT